MAWIKAQGSGLLSSPQPPMLGCCRPCLLCKRERDTAPTRPPGTLNAPAAAHLKEAGVICKTPSKPTGFDNLISHCTVAPESKYAVT